MGSKKIKHPRFFHSHSPIITEGGYAQVETPMEVVQESMTDVIVVLLVSNTIERYT